MKIKCGCGWTVQQEPPSQGQVFMQCGNCNAVLADYITRRSTGLKVISRIEPIPAPAFAAMCPCPTPGCGRCCCGVPECVNRIGGHPACRCSWIPIEELGDGNCFQAEGEGYIHVVWMREPNRSQCRRVITTDGENSELGFILMFHKGNIVKPRSRSRSAR